MKKSTKPSEKPSTKAKTEKPAAIVATEFKSKDTSSTKQPPNNQKVITPKPKPKVNTEQPIAKSVAQTNPKKPSPTPKSPGKAKAVAPKAEAPTTEITMPERVGLTAGNIWHYLDKNGATVVAKLISELPEEEKIIQRSIGWLAEEGKIAFNTIDRVETISLV